MADDFPWSASGEPIFAEFDDSMRSRWRIEGSTDATRPHLWVTVEGRPDGEGGTGRDGAGHLDREQARVLYDALGAWLQWADGEIARGEKW